MRRDRVGKMGRGLDLWARSKIIKEYKCIIYIELLPDQCRAQGKILRGIDGLVVDNSLVCCGIDVTTI